MVSSGLRGCLLYYVSSRRYGSRATVLIAVPWEVNICSFRKAVRVFSTALLFRIGRELGLLQSQTPGTIYLVERQRFVFSFGGDNFLWTVLKWKDAG